MNKQVSGRVAQQDDQRIQLKKTSNYEQTLPKNTPKDDDEGLWQPTARINHEDEGFVTKRGVLGMALESSRLQSKFLQTPVQVQVAPFLNNSGVAGLPSSRDNNQAYNNL